jgi:hypothetical protein
MRRRTAILESTDVQERVIEVDLILDKFCEKLTAAGSTCNVMRATSPDPDSGKGEAIGRRM